MENLLTSGVLSLTSDNINNMRNLLLVKRQAHIVLCKLLCNLESKLPVQCLAVHIQHHARSNALKHQYGRETRADHHLQYDCPAPPPASHAYMEQEEPVEGAIGDRRHPKQANQEHKQTVHEMKHEEFQIRLIIILYIRPGRVEPDKPAGVEDDRVWVIERGVESREDDQREG
nr:hypothetical protein LR48_Vigan01g128700 [Ipomoea batatas]